MTGMNLAQPDITLRLDKKGVIKEVSLSDRIAEAGVQALVGKSWETTVGDVGSSKVRLMLKQALADGVSAFRQINQHFPSGAELPIEFTTVRLGGQAGIVAIGKNLQTVAELQSRLVAAQQAIERDYWKFREIETRYRMLFDTSAEAVVVVRGAGLSIMEANPAAIRALGAAPANNDFLTMLPQGERDSVRAMLERVRDHGRAPGVLVHLSGGAEPWMLRASPMNAASRPAFLLQLAPVGAAGTVKGPEPAIDMEAFIDGLPDGFALIDADGVILRANPIFLDLVQIGSKTLVIGERIGRWLGRPGADLAMLLANVNQHGLIRLFATTLHGELGSEAEVEISAASRIEGGQHRYVVLIRDVATRLAAPQASGAKASIPGAIAKPIGSAPLRDLVSETTELIEQHYIEAALDLTNGNRKAAAELLGLSRQGLYAKLGRYGLNGGDPSADDMRS
ncbi:MAG: transcriptional regulator PpsR [Rhizobiales bacterium]|nr:transcriptional regulator PpsR [Hyphomicrobiales bacterium]